MASRYQSLKAERAKLADESKALFAILDAENRPLTDPEKARDTVITARFAEIDAECARWEAQFERERQDVASGIAARVQSAKDLAAEKPWKSFGEYLMAVKGVSYGQAADPRLLFQAAATGMGESVGVDGGFAVPPQFAPGIEKTMWDTGEILSRVDQRTIDGNSMTYLVLNETSRADGSRRGAVLGYWVDEVVAPTASSIKLARLEMKLRKVGALGYMSDELMADAAGLSGELETAFTEELQFQAENAVYRGGGTTQPIGFLGAPCLVTVSKEVGQAADTILTPNLSKMWARLPARSKKQAVWLINVDCEPQLDELSTPVGTAALEPRFVDYGPDGLLRIKGRPVIAVEYASSIGDLGDIALVDLSQYRMIRKSSGIEAASSMHVKFAQGEQTFRAFYRVDGQPVPRAAITPFKGSSTLSPFVILEAR